MDITLTGIEVWAHHGVLPHEAELGQRFLVDVTAVLALDGPVVDEDLTTTVDYGGLAEVAAAAATTPRADLVETVADRTARAVLDHDPRIEEVLVTVHKPGAPLTVPVADVAVSVTRGRAGRG